MLPITSTCEDLNALIQEHLAGLDPISGAWLCRMDQRGFIDTTEEVTQLYRITTELVNADANSPPTLDELTLDKIFAFCAWHANHKTSLRQQSIRLAQSLHDFVPWISRSQHLREIQHRLSTQAPIKCLLYAQQSDDLIDASFNAGLLADECLGPWDAPKLLNTRWAVVVAVKMSPEELVSDPAMATVAAQVWICWQPSI